MKARACCAALVLLLFQSDHDRLAHACCSGEQIMASPASAFLAVPAPIEAASCDDEALVARVLAGLSESPEH